MVYDADGGLVGELRYVVGHLIGRAECSLCDITHGPLRRKADFDDLVARLTSAGHQVHVCHRNEQDESQAVASTGALPCVLVADDAADGVGRVAEPWTVLVDADALRSCAGRVDALDRAISGALAARP